MRCTLSTLFFFCVVIHEKIAIDCDCRELERIVFFIAEMIASFSRLLNAHFGFRISSNSQRKHTNCYTYKIPCLYYIHSLIGAIPRTVVCMPSNELSISLWLLHFDVIKHTITLRCIEYPRFKFHQLGYAINISL